MERQLQRQLRAARAENMRLRGVLADTVEQKATLERQRAMEDADLWLTYIGIDPEWEQHRLDLLEGVAG